MKLRTIDIVILLTLGILGLARSSWGLYKDVNIDISSSKSILGLVSQAEIQDIELFTLKVKKFRTAFVIKLDNSEETFAIDRGISVCKFLSSQIKKGDTIQIFYRASTGDINTHVFQIEKNKEIIINAKDYSKKETKMIVWGFIFGFIVTGGTIFWVIRQKKTKSRRLQT